jgi:hypothetical protein
MERVLERESKISKNSHIRCTYFFWNFAIVKLFAEEVRARASPTSRTSLLFLRLSSLSSIKKLK